MGEKIRALLFDFTKDNLDAHESGKVNITSGENVLEDVIQFENGEFNDSPFVRLFEIEGYSSHILNPQTIHIKGEQLSNILEVDKNNLCFYSLYNRYFLKRGRGTYTIEVKTSRQLMFLANKEMFKGGNIPIFEIRVKMDIHGEEKWSSWQAVAGKFIVIGNSYSSGIAEVYNSMTEKEIETFKQDFQIRYSGSSVLEFEMGNYSLPRIINDPFNSDIRKIIDPYSFQILFDSQIIKEVSREKSCEYWEIFEERYK